MIQGGTFWIEIYVYDKQTVQEGHLQTHYCDMIKTNTGNQCQWDKLVREHKIRTRVNRKVSYILCIKYLPSNQCSQQTPWRSFKEQTKSNTINYHTEPYSIQNARSISRQEHGNLSAHRINMLRTRFSSGHKNSNKYINCYRHLHCFRRNGMDREFLLCGRHQHWTIRHTESTNIADSNCSHVMVQSAGENKLFKNKTRLLYGYNFEN